MAELSARRSCCSTMCSCAGVRPPHLALQAAIPLPQLLSHSPAVVQVASLLLQRQDGRREQAAAVMRAVAAAAQAAMAVDTETTAVIAEALRRAEAAAAGQLSFSHLKPNKAALEQLSTAAGQWRVPGGSPTVLASCKTALFSGLQSAICPCVLQASCMQMVSRQALWLCRAPCSCMLTWSTAVASRAVGPWLQQAATAWQTPCCACRSVLSNTVR